MDSYEYTLDASLRCYELIHVQTNEDGTERGRGLLVTTAWAHENGYDFAIRDRTSIARLFDEQDPPFVELKPFVDMSYPWRQLG